MSAGESLTVVSLIASLHTLLFAERAPKVEKIRSVIRKSERKKQFLTSLAADLRSMGVSARVATRNNQLAFHTHLPERGKIDQLRFMKAARRQQLQASAAFIDKMSSGNLSRLFIDGGELVLENISPRIHICRTDADFEVFRYCRLLQSVPSANRIGRQICALVYDEGQARSVLIGAIGLASCIYTVTCRDRYLNWLGSDRTEIKNKGLRQLMDLSICMSLPPYSFLFGGKLVALLAMTDQLRDEFKRKYKLPLLGLTTTCATGLHCPIFNRIMIKEGGLYRRIGETAGYTTSFFSTTTLSAARELARDYYPIGDGQHIYKPIQILYRALRICGLPYVSLVRLGIAKGVYFASLSSKSLLSLRKGGGLRVRESLAVGAAAEFWKTQLLPKRKENNDILRSVSEFRGQSLLLRGPLLQDRRT